MENRNFSKKFLKKSKKRKQKIIMDLAALAGLCVIIAVTTAIIFFSKQLKIYSEEIPSEEEIKAKVSDTGQNSFIYDRNGNLLYIFRDPNRDREYADIEEIPPTVKWALLAAEDESFYEHSGIDFAAIFRSISIYISSGGQTKVGGSTLTQQLVKNTVLSNEKTLDRKVKEMIISLIIEKDYTKDYILEMYLNSAPFGGRITGIKSAARNYFSKEVSELTLSEAVFLMSLIQKPGEASPLFTNNEQLAWDIVEERQKYIFSQIDGNYDYIKSVEPDFPSNEDIEKHKSEVINLQPNLGEIQAPHFVFYIKSILEKEPYNISEEQLYTGGYRIHTSLDIDLQKIAEKNLAAGIEKYSHYGMNNGALVTIDPKAGEILAMVGSKDYWGERTEDGSFDPQVNVALSTRNLGSSLKPFLAYEAFRQRKFNPYSVVYDSPINIRGYKPKNYDGRYYGKMSVATALEESRNIPFIRILDKVGVQNFLNLLNNLGYSEATRENTYGLAIALGGFNSNLLEHTQAYSALAGEGTMAKTRGILKIEDSRGNVIVENGVETSQVLETRYTEWVNKILLSYGTNGVAGKTGTTDENRDNYFIGYTDKFVTGVWVGNNNNARMSSKAFGSTTATPIWNMYYAEAMQLRPEYRGRLRY